MVDLSPILPAIETIVDKRLSEISYDKTVVCEVLQVNKNTNEYIVSDGNMNFTAYSDNEKQYFLNQKVYVVIPQGNYSFKKLIIGNYSAEDKKAYAYVHPFEDFVDVTGNLRPANKTKLEASPSADGIPTTAPDTDTDSVFQISDVPNNFGELKYIGLSGTFTTLLENTTKGNYGLRVGLRDSEGEEVYFTFDSSEMYGNPYYYDGGFKFSKAFEYPAGKTFVAGEIELYQNGNFNGDDISNKKIIVDDIYLSFAYSQEDFQENKFTLQISDDTETQYSPNIINPITIYANHIAYNQEKKQYEKNELDPSSPISWFRYRVGNANVGGGAHWEQLFKLTNEGRAWVEKNSDGKTRLFYIKKITNLLNAEQPDASKIQKEIENYNSLYNSNLEYNESDSTVTNLPDIQKDIIPLIEQPIGYSFTNILNEGQEFIGKNDTEQYRITSFPNINYQNEQIKAILKYNDQNITSDIVKFEYTETATGEEVVDTNGQIILNLNNIGYYPVYGDNNKFIDGYSSSTQYSITAEFADGRNWSNAKSIEWHFPDQSLIFVNGATLEGDKYIYRGTLDENGQLNRILNYKLKEPYYPSQNILTIYCYVKDANDNVSSDKIQLQFGRQGSSGTDFSLRLTDGNGGAPWKFLYCQTKDQLIDSISPSLLLQCFRENSSEKIGTDIDFVKSNERDGVYIGKKDGIEYAKWYSKEQKLIVSNNTNTDVKRIKVGFKVDPKIFHNGFQNKTKFFASSTQQDLLETFWVDDETDNDNYVPINKEKSQGYFTLGELIESDENFSEETKDTIYLYTNFLEISSITNTLDLKIISETKFFESETKTLVASVKDVNGNPIDLTDTEKQKIKWEWVYDFSGDNSSSKIHKGVDKGGQCSFYVQSIGEYCNAILKVSYPMEISAGFNVDLIYYHPIAVTDIPETTGIIGATEVQYDTNGNVANYDEDLFYKLYGVENNTIEIQRIKLIDSFNNANTAMPVLKDKITNNIILNGCSIITKPVTFRILRPNEVDYQDISFNENGEAIASEEGESGFKYASYTIENGKIKLTVYKPRAFEENGVDISLQRGYQIMYGINHDNFELGYSLESRYYYKDISPLYFWHHPTEGQQVGTSIYLDQVANKDNILKLRSNSQSDSGGFEAAVEKGYAPKDFDILVTEDFLWEDFSETSQTFNPEFYLPLNNTTSIYLKPNSVNTLGDSLEEQWSCVNIYTSNEEGIFQQPIHLYYNRYGTKFLNSWDNQFKIDEENNTILSSLLVAGKKNNENQFTGVVIGDVGKADKTNELYGVYGYKDGKKRFQLDEDGNFYVGQKDESYINFEEDNLSIKSKRLIVDSTGLTMDDNTFKIEANLVPVSSISIKEILADKISSVMGNGRYFDSTTSKTETKSMNILEDSYTGFWGNINLSGSNQIKVDNWSKTSGDWYNKFWKVNTNTTMSEIKVTITYTISSSYGYNWIYIGMCEGCPDKNGSYNSYKIQTVSSGGTYEYSFNLNNTYNGWYFFINAPVSSDNGNLKSISPKTFSYTETVEEGTVAIEGYKTELCADDIVGKARFIQPDLIGPKLTSPTSGTSIEVNSDIKLKHEINPLSNKYLSLIKSVEPVSYKYNNGTSNRFHTGFIAQQVKEQLQANNLTTQEFAGLTIDNDDIHRLRYEEFIALNTLAIQDLYKYIEVLEARIQELEKKEDKIE